MDTGLYDAVRSMLIRAERRVAGWILRRDPPGFAREQPREKRTQLGARVGCPMEGAIAPIPPRSILSTRWEGCCSGTEAPAIKSPG